MSPAAAPRTLPTALRLVLFLLALILMGGIFVIMRALFLPSQYLQAYKVVEKGPGRASDLNRMQILTFNSVLYLAGPVQAASGKKGGPLFPYGARPILAPSTYSDASGAVEILAEGPPESTTSLSNYFYNEPVHMLGWRTSASGLSLFMIGKTKDDLLALTLRRSENWKRTLVIQSLLLLALVYVIFWFLNMAVLSNVAIRLAQVLSVDVIFLILLYSALILSGYPMTSTLPIVLLVLLAGNAVFVPLAVLFRHKPGPKTT